MELKKKVILIIIDSFNPKAFEKALRNKLTPALSFLKDKGYFAMDCVSVFPTMTPTACSSIVTGQFPDAHKVPGFIWFSRKEGRFINYGATLGAILKQGLNQVLQDLVLNLNKKQLSKKSKTIFELLEAKGFSTAAINFFIYRGKNPFIVKVPWLVNLLTNFKLLKVMSFMEGLLGPKILFFGEACNPLGLFSGKNIKLPTGPLNKFGVNDEFSGLVSSQIIKEGFQPDFMLVYLPDTDGYCHRYEPEHSEYSLAKADYQIQRILNSFSSWDKALEETIFMVVGDHSQSLVKNGELFAINLPEILQDFKQAKLGKKIFLKKDIAICPNERMAYIYLLKNKRENKIRILNLLKKESRLDLICWQEKKGEQSYIHIVRGGENSNSELIFWPKGPYKDIYGENWGYEGDLTLIDAKVIEGKGEEKIISFHNYPDAFKRIYSTLQCEEAGEIIVTAKLGYELAGEAAPLHPGGGSHGSLHREDSLVPLIVTEEKLYQGIKKITDVLPVIVGHFTVT